MNIKNKVILTTLLITTCILACVLPFSTQPTPYIPPTPNMTLTVLAVADILEASVPPSPIPIIVTPTVSSESSPTISPPEIVRSPTPSYTPTFTPAVVTYPQRPGAIVVAANLGTSPNLDGNWDEWNTTEYPAGYIVYGWSNWDNYDDLQASFRIGWDKNNLYVAVKVKDDLYVQNASGQNLYKGDSIEILLDTNLYDDFYYNQLSTDDYQLGISPGNPDVNGTREAVLWYPGSRSGSRPEVTIASIGGDGLYRVEAASPWSVFNISPYVGRRLGFALSVSDNDNHNENVQQSMASNVIGRKLTMPMTWGELVLK